MRHLNHLDCFLNSGGNCFISRDLSQPPFISASVPPPVLRQQNARFRCLPLPNQYCSPGWSGLNNQHPTCHRGRLWPRGIASNGVSQSMRLRRRRLSDNAHLIRPLSQMLLSKRLPSFSLDQNRYIKFHSCIFIFF